MNDPDNKPTSPNNPFAKFKTANRVKSILRTEVSDPLSQNTNELQHVIRQASQGSGLPTSQKLSPVQTSDDQALIIKTTYPGIRIFPSLRNTVNSLIFLTAITFVLRLFSPTDFWTALPFQVYWSYWLFTISYACSQKYKSALPISLRILGLISILSFVFLPRVSTYHFNRLIDPFFYLWLFTLGYIPYRIGKFLDWHDDKTQSGSSGIALAAGAIALPFFVVLVQNITSDLFDPSLGLGIAWFLAQFSWITYVVLKLAGRLDSLAANNQISEKKIHAGTDIVIRYRAFPELERWLKQKFRSKTIAKGARLFLMWFAGPTLVIISVLGLNFFVGSLMANPFIDSPQVRAAAAAVSAANLNFISQFIFGLVALILITLTLVLARPTHLALGEKGMRFLWRHRMFNSDGPYLPWNTLTNIFIEHPSNQASTTLDRLCFRETNTYVTKIHLNAIDSFEDKEMLLNAICTWAPKISRDAHVIESLQPPADYSYTELWLQALSAPPKRERFKPLVEGALVKNARYKVIRSLGSGGQGFAYLAEDCPNQTEIVLKEFILPVYVDISVRKSALEQFENEARILRQLDNPQIVKLLDFFVEDHRAYLVLEHIDGASLRNIIERTGPLSERKTIYLAYQMCDVLSYLHSQAPPVVHRDFTPDNLILGNNSVLKLIDFNVAQNTESTTTGTVVGKPAYLPPEQFRGTPSTQSDIYAMGATLYFLLTSHDPKPISISHPAEIISSISQGMDQIVARATDLDTAKRYANVADLKQNLERLLKRQF